MANNSSGKLKQLVDSDIFSETKPSNIPAIVSAPPLVKDLLRQRAGYFWSIENNIPEINSSDSAKKAFSLQYDNLPIRTENKLLGESTQDITLVANRGLFYYSPEGSQRGRRSQREYNPQYWKEFIGPLSLPAQPTITIAPPGALGLEAVATETSEPQQNENPNSSSNRVRNLLGLNRPAPATQTNSQPNVSAAPSDPLSNPIAATSGQAQSEQRNQPQPLPSFSVIPTINNNNVFFDHKFELNLPFTKKELKLFNAPGGSMFVEMDPNYNFFIESYETVLGNTIIAEQLIPNMYVFATELRNENTDAQNTIFKQHITLAGSIPDTFIDITNNKGEKIGEKDKGEYFDKYASSIGEMLRRDPTQGLFLKNKFTNIITPTSNIDLFKDFNEKREMFPMYFDLSFSTETTTQFSQVLEDSQLSAVLLRDLVDGRLLPQLSGFQETTVKAVTGQPSDVESTKQNLRTWDLTSWVEDVSNNPTGLSNTLNTGILMGPITDEINLVSDSQYDLYKNLLIIIFSGKLKTIVENNFRSFKDLMDGKSAYSENVLYRVEKINTTTGEVIQNFYFPNSNKIGVLRFIDTQVKYNKRYTYKIFVYQMVVGNKYSYNLKALGDDTANVEVSNEPSLKLVEVLFAELTGRIMDNPPISPDVDIIPYRAVNNQILFNINSATGRYFLEPIIIESGDAEIIKQLREAQAREEERFLEYETDDHAAAFEIFRVSSKPHSYQDFTGKRIALVPTDISAVSLQSATAASFLDNIVPNKKYYYTFRTIDNHGHISNPTPIFQIEMIDADGSIYPIIEIVDFEKNIDLRANSKIGKKFIQITPVFNQKIVNEKKSGLEINGERIESVLQKDNIFLGIADEPVWGKVFKIRLTSKKTGKKIDLNVEFTHSHRKKND